MSEISKITLPNGKEYDFKDTTARNAANSAVPNTRTVNGKALSSNISLGAGDVGAYTKSETDTKINAAIASAYKYKGSVTADKLPTSGQVVGDVYNITNDSSYGKAGMNVAWTGTTWDALGSNVDLSNYVTTSDSRLSNARPASDVYAWAKAAKKPSYSASEINGLGSLATKNGLSAGDVGLGNVANIDQSKAIKSITRNGTTFTATALDGTTSTFTQQDTNTTYGVATSSANGLMSKSDKAKLDGIDPSAITTNAANIKKNADAISVRASLIPTGKAIYAGDDLNNISYTAVGTYYCSAIAEAQHISNLPEVTAFMMTVYNPLGLLTGPLSTSWQYRVQEFMPYYGTQKYIRMVSTNGESNVIFEDWVKMTNSNDLGAVSNTINTHIANKSNPHGVTKAQVGLGSVANLDQSKAIKSITRSGTTFTATALDGTTSTFTQQDTNTTYGVASQSSNGLMSAADKKAIDREFFRMVPKGGTYIPENADLNSIEYIKVGNYYNTFDRESRTIKNIPVIKAFMMYVLSPLEVYDLNESTDQWVYRLRIFVTHTGEDIFVQKVASGATAGRFNYGPWVKMTNSNDLGAFATKQESLNHVVASKTQPSNQQAGDIWLIIK